MHSVHWYTGEIQNPSCKVRETVDTVVCRKTSPEASRSFPPLPLVECHQTGLKTQCVISVITNYKMNHYNRAQRKAAISAALTNSQLFQPNF